MSSLSSLASNLLTPGFENFRGTAKVFSSVDMDLVTRMEMYYPYEYTDKWEKLGYDLLSPKAEFYIIP